MSPEDIDWRFLERARSGFLGGTAGTRDYWESERALASYDATFAQRIGWKWDFVLTDLRQLGWEPPAGDVMDWACGSGIAARAFLDHFGTETVTSLQFVDRSQLAMRYAATRAGRRFPNLKILAGMEQSRPPATILVSHAITELSADALQELVARLQTATSVLWVEPGTHEASRALVAIREQLREHLHPVAPCVHAARCGLLAPGNEPHWCHHFATPPAGVFTDPFWGRFGHLLEIDLRSVPLSYLVLDKRAPRSLPSGAVRILGRPRITKAGLRVFACDPAGVREHSLARNQFPEAWRDARKGRAASLQVWSSKERQP